MINPKIVKYVFGFFAVSIVILGLVTKPNNESSEAITPPQSENHYTQKLQINNAIINIEVADRPEKQSQGLSNRPSMKRDEGMLFIFENYNAPSFWMKDMLFPLDFIWIKDDRVVEIHKNISQPKPNTPDSQLELISPKEPVNYVLEVNAGFVERNRIEVGDKVEINNSNNINIPKDSNGY